MSINVETLSPEYRRLFESLQIRPDKKDKIEWNMNRLLKNRFVYEQIGMKTGVPWFLIGAIHGREGSFDLRRCLHNGDQWNQKTKNYPPGRGPFDSFEESAIDALIFDDLISVKNWNLEKCLFYAEKFNGFGYRRKYPHILSPYLWAASYHYTAGGYSHDFRFDPKFIDDTVGVAVMFKKLEELGLIRFADQESSITKPPESKPIKQSQSVPLRRRLFGFLSRLFRF